MRSALLALTFLLLPVHAQAACFENVGGTGCSDDSVFVAANLEPFSCESLWYVRNAIYDDNGYCFRTKRALAIFDNADCSVRDAAKLKLNGFERKNIALVQKVERQKSCPR